MIMGIVFGCIFFIVTVVVCILYCFVYKKPAVIHDQESVQHIHSSQADEMVHEKGSVYFSEVAGASCSICLFD